MDIGLYHVKTLAPGMALNAGSLFTVDDGYNVHLYERPYGVGAVEIRRAVAVAFIDEQNSAQEYRIAGRYPNYYLQEVR
jgi:hypothetical protein